MALEDPYSVLGLPRGASQAEIRRAYRKLAKQHHPDLNAGNKAAEERFKQLGAAYARLSGPKPQKFARATPPSAASREDPLADYSYEDELEKRYETLRKGARHYPDQERRGRPIRDAFRNSGLFVLEILVSILKIFDQILMECWTLIKWLTPLG